MCTKVDSGILVANYKMRIPAHLFFPFRGSGGFPAESLERSRKVALGTVNWDG